MALAASLALAAIAGPGAWAAQSWGRGAAERSSAKDGRSDPMAGPVPAETLTVAGKPAPAEVSGELGFSHGVHKSVECTSCHLAEESHGALKVRTHEDCVACHHATSQPAACARCHAGSKLPAPSTQKVQVRTSVGGATSRGLPFAHAYHGSVSCAECHGAPPSAKPLKDCTSCHERHHTQARDCQRCHRPEDVKGHPAMAAHTGCTAGGCHGDKTVAALGWSRNVCLVCHQDQAKHEAGRECATCHQVPALHSTRKEVAP